MADLLLYPPIRIESPTREDLARRVASIRALALIAVVVASTACGSTREAESSSSTNPAIERAEPEQPPAPVSLDQCVVSVSDAVHESYRTEGQAVPITTVLTWAPTHFIRALEFPPPQAALTLGTILIILSPAGVFTGGWLADWLQQRGNTDAP